MTRKQNIIIQGKPLSTISIASARLPETYEAAKKALAACVRVDECKSWADKAAAIASYARMAEDQDLHRRATRVQGWAVRRVGELLEEANAGVGRPVKTSSERPISKAKVGGDAGLSRYQIKQSSRIAGIPEETFKAAIESAEPPSVTKLADMGTQRHELPPPPPGHAEATQVQGLLRDIDQLLARHQPDVVAGGVKAKERAAARARIDRVIRWLELFDDELQKELAA